MAVEQLTRYVLTCDDCKARREPPLEHDPASADMPPGWTCSRDLRRGSTFHGHEWRHRCPPCGLQYLEAAAAAIREAVGIPGPPTILLHAGRTEPAAATPAVGPARQAIDEEEHTSGGHANASRRVLTVTRRPDDHRAWVAESDGFLPGKGTTPVQARASFLFVNRDRFGFEVVVVDPPGPVTWAEYNH